MLRSQLTLILNLQSVKHFRFHVEFQSLRTVYAWRGSRTTRVVCLCFAFFYVCLRVQLLSFRIRVFRHHALGVVAGDFLYHSDQAVAKYLGRMRYLTVIADRVSSTIHYNAQKGTNQKVRFLSTHLYHA